MRSPATPHAGEGTRPSGPLAIAGDDGGGDASTQMRSSPTTPTDSARPTVGGGPAGEEKGEPGSDPSPTPPASPWPGAAQTRADASVQQHHNAGTEAVESDLSEIDSNIAVDDGAGHGETAEGTGRVDARPSSIWFDPAPAVEAPQEFGQAPEWLASEPDEPRRREPLNHMGTDLGDHVEAPPGPTPDSDKLALRPEKPLGRTGDPSREQPGGVGASSGEAPPGPDQRRPTVEKANPTDAAPRQTSSETDLPSEPADQWLDAAKPASTADAAPHSSEGVTGLPEDVGRGTDGMGPVPEVLANTRKRMGRGQAGLESPSESESAAPAAGGVTPGPDGRGLVAEGVSAAPEERARVPESMEPGAEGLTRVPGDPGRGEDGKESVAPGAGVLPEDAARARDGEGRAAEGRTVVPRNVGRMADGKEPVAEGVTVAPEEAVREAAGEGEGLGAEGVTVLAGDVTGVPDGKESVTDGAAAAGDRGRGPDGTGPGPDAAAVVSEDAVGVADTGSGRGSEEDAPDGMGHVPGGVESGAEARDEEDAPPGLEPGLQEMVRRLATPGGQSPEQTAAPVASVSPAGPLARRQPTDGVGATVEQAASPDEGDGDGAEVAVEAHGDPASEAGQQQASGTSVKGPQKENISPARAASKRGRGPKVPKSSPTGQPRSNVSRETLSSGEVADNVGKDEVMEDEAAIAVREAALRAAAEVPGANDSEQQDATPDSQGDVSRETLRSEADSAGGAPDNKAADNGSRSPEEPTPRVDMERAARDARVTFRIAHGAYNRFAIAVANQKGGVGKSTTAVNLGAYLALAGARVLVVDLDPQGNASTGLGLDHRQIEPSVYDVLMGDSDAASAIRQTPVQNLDVLPSTIDLAGAEVELVNAFSRETRLRQALGAVRYGYDLVFIDCPPSLGLLTVNALAAADELLIPIQCEYYALEGLGQLLRNVDLVRVNLNQALHIGGIVLTMYDGRTRLAEQVVQEVRKHFTDLVYQTVVPRSVRLSESPGYGVPIALYDPLSRGGIAYRDLALELADRTGLLAPTREGAN
jgi:chromosome partitioning protein